MESLKTIIKKDSLHHAYLLEGGPELVHDLLSPFLKSELTIEVRGNLDVFYRDYDSFGINDARLLRDWTTKKSAYGGLMLAIISFFSMTHEAQNALLKLFEEPTKDTHFFIITPTISTLLPTLRSRTMEVPLLENGKSNFQFAEEYLKATPKKRFELLHEMIENKDKASAASFLQSLEATLHKNIDLQKADENTVFALKEIIRCRSYLSDRSPSVKMILEHISLIAPQI